jgi:spore germination protein KB
MSDEVISSSQKKACIVMFLFGSTLVLGTGAGAKKDVWLAVLIAIIVAVPVNWIYAKIHSSYMDKDLFDIYEIVFGKYIGKILSIIYIWFAFQLGGLVIINFDNFITTIGPNETPTIVWSIIITGLSCYAAKLGIEVLGRWSGFFLKMLLLLIAITFTLSTSKFQFNNVRPILYEGVQPVMKGAFSSLTFPFAEVVIFLMVLSGFKEKNEPIKVYLSALALGGFCIFILGARNILVLGEAALSRSYFPSYLAVSRINIGEFLQRLEIAVSVSFLSTGFVKISVCLLAASKGISKLFNLQDYRFIVIPVGIAMINFASSQYESVMEARRWAFEVWPYYAFPFQVVIPLLTLIAIKLRKKAAN